MRICYRASLFGDFQSVKPTPEYTIQLIAALRDHGLSMLPSTVQELAPPSMTPVNRPSFSSEDGSVQVAVLLSRLDVSKTGPMDGNSNIGDMATFSDLVEKCAAAALAGSSIQGTRVAFVVQAFCQDHDPIVIDGAFLKIFNPPEFYQDGTSKEWTFRANNLTNLDFDDCREQVNVITKIERVQGVYWAYGTQQKEFDKIAIEVDVNTSQSNSLTRFTSSNLSAFVRAASAIVSDMELKSSDHLGVKW